MLNIDSRWPLLRRKLHNNYTLTIVLFNAFDTPFINYYPILTHSGAAGIYLTRNSPCTRPIDGRYYQHSNSIN